MTCLAFHTGLCDALVNKESFNQTENNLQLFLETFDHSRLVMNYNREFTDKHHQYTKRQERASPQQLQAKSVNWLLLRNILENCVIDTTRIIIDLSKRSGKHYMCDFVSVKKF